MTLAMNAKNVALPKRIQLSRFLPHEKKQKQRLFYDVP